MLRCRSIGCTHNVPDGEDFCAECTDLVRPGAGFLTTLEVAPAPTPTPAIAGSSMAARYPQYYKSLHGLVEIDVYAVHQLFAINDPSGAIQHASKKLLLSGVRTGGKSMYADVKEARDSLTRWLELNPETKKETQAELV